MKTIFDFTIILELPLATCMFNLSDIAIFKEWIIMYLLTVDHADRIVSEL